MPISRTALPLFAALGLGACASAGEDYPSLAIRDAERQSGSFTPAESEAAAPVEPDPPAPELLDRLVQLQSQAQSAHRAFVALAPAASRRVEAARGAGLASDRWAEAQIAISELDSQRSLTAVPMADLDELLVRRAIELEQRAEIVEAQAQVQALLEEEDAVLRRLKGALAR
ncbi:hypothetical protein [Erythrobacter litoralis]|uniref:Lipoprotein n=1 Tax=Erythrobacter litoralis (strain HTCC2594) TaxID=314225 RepID=Q2NCD8_ERYLH|nr:hypothetical protein [Erythrobacter litoralis]ABC62653.1 hypothetical protein ELI_02805 [Erythrobacter litoralis HTCC2594]